MTKNKHPIFRMHKIKVHHNRWLIWAGAYSVFVAIALLGYITVTTLNFDTDLLSSENHYVPWRGYTNHELGFTLRYPGDWSIEAVSHESVNFVPLDFSRPSVNVSVFDADDESVVRRGMDIVDEKETVLGGIPAVIITDEIAEGARETVIMSEYDGSLYTLRGPKGSVEQFAQSFSFLNE